MTSLKMEKRRKSSKKRHMNISTHQTRKMIQVTTPSKIKTKTTKNMPPLKVTAQEKLLKKILWSNQKGYKQIKKKER